MRQCSFQDGTHAGLKKSPTTRFFLSSLGDLQSTIHAKLSDLKRDANHHLTSAQVTSTQVD